LRPLLTQEKEKDQAAPLLFGEKFKQRNQPAKGGGVKKKGKSHKKKEAGSWTQCCSWGMADRLPQWEERKGEKDLQSCAPGGVGKRRGSGAAGVPSSITGGGKKDFGPRALT